MISDKRNYNLQGKNWIKLFIKKKKNWIKLISKIKLIKACSHIER